MVQGPSARPPFLSIKFYWDFIGPGAALHISAMVNVGLCVPPISGLGFPIWAMASCPAPLELPLGPLRFPREAEGSVWPFLLSRRPRSPEWVPGPSTS